MKTTKTYHIDGLSCAACATSSARILSKIDTVDFARVNYATQTAVIEGTELNVELINQRLSKAGFRLFERNAAAENNLKATQKKAFRKLRLELIVAAVFSVPLFIISMFFMGALPYENYILFALCLPVMLWSGRPFFQGAWQKLSVGSSNMDSLVALGTGTAFLYSVFNTFFPEVLQNQGIELHVYYETAGLLIFFILLGRYIEAAAKKRSFIALESLLSLKIDQVTFVDEQGNEKKFPIAVIQKGDLIMVRPGEKIPMDAQIVKGKSEINESMLTGEPLPILKTNDDLVFAGTLNGTGNLLIRVNNSDGDNMLDKIIDLVERAQSSHAPIQKKVDKISSIFVPIVMLIALLSAILWAMLGPMPSITYAIIAAVTVLVIACPCALGLATPMAIMVGIGVAARKGMLIKGAKSLEAAQKIDTILLDKTGTITEGKPKVFASKWKYPDLESSHAGMLLLLEQLSEHPLAKAIVEHYLSIIPAAAVESFESKTGTGVFGNIAGVDYWAGKLTIAKEMGVEMEDSLLSQAESWLQAACTVIYFGNQTELLAVIALKDQPKASSKKAISKLKAMGLDLQILTGDNAATAALIAGEMGIKNYHADLLPEDKISIVKALQKQGRNVAMLGDGINDAPALAQANLGMAMHNGTDVAMESADMVLLQNDLMQVLDAIKLSKATMRILNQNLFWAFFYNMIGIPLAAGLFYPIFGLVLNPMLAGAAMAFSSVSVVLNSLRLMRNG